MADNIRTGLLQGFIDYDYCFDSVPILWIVIGLVFLVISFIAYMPQTLELLDQKTSYGLSTISVYGQTTMQFFQIMNVIHLMAYDYVGLLQHNFGHTFKNYITFLSLFTQWIEYIPVVFLSMMFHDREERSLKDEKAFKRSWIQAMLMVSGCLTTNICLLFIWAIIGFKVGFQSNSIQIVGQLYGYIATAIDFCQFIPQLVETCRIRSAGALSLTQLEIQAFSDLAQALFMWLGQGVDLSTYLNGIMDSMSEFLLIFVCFAFKFNDKRAARQAAVTQSLEDHIFARVKVTPLPLDTFSSPLVSESDA